MQRCGGAPRAVAPGYVMIGIVIITHGNLAREFRSVLEHVVGPQSQIAAIAITPDDDMEERREAILRAMKSVDTGDGLVLLTDMFGGTPSNLAISAMNGANVEVIAGVNLPMLIKLTRVREESHLREAADAARDAGQKYIRVVSEMLAGS